MFDFRRITLFRLGKRLSKHKMTIFYKNLGGHDPFAPPGYAYVRRQLFLYSLVQTVVIINCGYVFVNAQSFSHIV